MKGRIRRAIWEYFFGLPCLKKRETDEEREWSEIYEDDIKDEYLYISDSYGEDDDEKPYRLIEALGYDEALEVYVAIVETDDGPTKVELYPFEEGCWIWL